MMFWPIHFLHVVPGHTYNVGPATEAWYERVKARCVSNHLMWLTNPDPHSNEGWIGWLRKRDGRGPPSEYVLCRHCMHLCNCTLVYKFPEISCPSSSGMPSIWLPRSMLVCPSVVEDTVAAGTSTSPSVNCGPLTRMERSILESRALRSVRDTVIFADVRGECSASI